MDASPTGTGDGLLLRGIDGSNPLAFLAALGTLRVASMLWPDRHVRVCWRQHAGAWQPVLNANPSLSMAELAKGLARYCRMGDASANDPRTTFPYLTFDQNTSKLEPGRFRDLACEARRQSGPRARSFADFVAAFGCEANVEDGYTQDTALRTMSGSGHQHFLGTMLSLVEDVGEDHIRASLFERWHFGDPLKSHSMRWDPKDDKRHAYQWTDPTHSSERAAGGMWGANRLAIEGVPMLPTMPTMRGLGTTGFSPRGQKGTRWRWPVWTPPISAEVCMSLLAHPELQKSELPRRELKARGVAEVFESQRINVGYFRNFTQARAV